MSNGYSKQHIYVYYICILYIYILLVVQPHKKCYAITHNRQGIFVMSQVPWIQDSRPREHSDDETHWDNLRTRSLRTFQRPQEITETGQTNPNDMTCWLSISSVLC